MCATYRCGQFVPGITAAGDIERATQRVLFGSLNPLRATVQCKGGYNKSSSQIIPPLWRTWINERLEASQLSPGLPLAYSPLPCFFLCCFLCLSGVTAVGGWVTTDEGWALMREWTQLFKGSLPILV
jgi:hypothetical protein